jgi:cytochrome c-type biogenesis protein CcmF
MIPELGQFALILALGMACIQALFPLVGATQGNFTWMSLARPTAQGQFVFMAISFSCLVYRELEKI